MSVAPSGSEKNFNRVAVIALTEFVAQRKREAFALAMEEMAADQALAAECSTINRDFLLTETDGLSDD